MSIPHSLTYSYKSLVKVNDNKFDDTQSVCSYLHLVDISRNKEINYK